MKVKKRNQIVFLVFLTIIWVGVIFLFSLQSVEVSNQTSMAVGDELIGTFAPKISKQLEGKNEVQLASVNVFFRKCAHFFEYFILGVLSALVLTQTSLHHKNILCVAFCILVASIDETIQVFSEGRYGKLPDVLLDGVGAAIGILLVWYITYKLFHRKKKNIVKR